MTIARRRAEGLWVDGSTVSGLDFEHFDANLAEAVDGRGGAYILTEDLEFGGADLILGNNLQVVGNATVDGDITIGDDLLVTGDATVSGNATVTAALTVGMGLSVAASATILGGLTIGTDIAIGDDATIAGDLTVTGPSTLGNANIGGALVVTGSTTLAGSLDADGNCYLGSASGFVEVLGTTTVRENMSFGGDGKVVWRQQTVATDANQTSIAAQVDSFILPNGVFTAARSVTIDDTGAADGMRVNFRSRDTSFIITVKDPGGNNLDTLHGTTKPWGYAERIGGSWVWHLGGVP
jgi:carbonic anhydrase/acetyltransferase-like protein (isoleucine patch superfamily)